ncbi:DMT family transporter [Limibaculum sp. M0105]|uniref:DMT family transporter n=1 Tax=Thermohalobaculum xanthum TaxID=2753746 RepID=A0A8J7SER3_9RHOB|nr:DMT family transporter [Thermohalobaculum xanthum]MBK0399102.1 DMT family transporter [Thermohalobaculum xanthum]
MPSRPRADLMVAPLFVVLWSTGFIGAKLGLPHAEPLTFLTLRYALVVVLIGAWVALSSARPLTLRQAADAALIGVLIHAVYLGGVFTAISLGTEAGMAALIVGLQPIVTALIARRMLGERLTPLQWAGMAVGVAGVALVVARKLGDGVGDWRGVALCMVSLVTIAIASILQKTRAADHPMRAATLVQFAAATVATAPFALMFESNRIDWTGEFVFALGWLVLVLSVGAVTLLYILIRRGAASNVASLFFLVPASTALIAWALFGETLTPVELAGVAATALGVLMVNRPALFRRLLGRG